jgi:hypothetical protein
MLSGTLCRLLGAIVCLALVGIPSAYAASPRGAAKREAAERAARKACLDGDVSAAVATLSELFIDTKDPTYIYNQGRCFEQNGRYQDAILRFREYLRTATNLAQAEQDNTNKHIADCEALLAKQAPPPKYEPPNPPPSQPAPLPPANVVVAQSSPAPAPVAAGSGLRTTGLIVAGVGGATLVTGLVLNLKANSTVDSYGDKGTYTTGKESDRKTVAALGWTAYGVGAACVVTGAVLYTLGLRAAASPSVAVVPLVGRDAAGAVVQGAF